MKILDGAELSEDFHPAGGNILVAIPKHRPRPCRCRAAVTALIEGSLFVRRPGAPL